MKRKMKVLQRILAVLLSVIVSICFLPNTVYAGLKVGNSITLKFYIGEDFYYASDPEGYTYDGNGTYVGHFKITDKTIQLLYQPMHEDDYEGKQFIGWQSVDGRWIEGSSIPLDMLPSAQNGGEYTFTAVYKDYLVIYDLNGGAISMDADAFLAPDDPVVAYDGLDDSEKGTYKLLSATGITPKPGYSAFCNWMDRMSKKPVADFSDFDFAANFKIAYLQAVYGNPDYLGRIAYCQAYDGLSSITSIDDIDTQYLVDVIGGPSTYDTSTGEITPVPTSGAPRGKAFSTWVVYSIDDMTDPVDISVECFNTAWSTGDLVFVANWNLDADYSIDYLDLNGVEFNPPITGATTKYTYKQNEATYVTLPPVQSTASSDTKTLVWTDGKDYYQSNTTYTIAPDTVGNIVFMEALTDSLPHTITIDGLEGIDQDSIAELKALGFVMDNDANPTAASITKSVRDSLVIPEVTKPHYAFNGWQNNANFDDPTKTVVLDVGDITSDLSYAATFSPINSVTVNFNLNGGAFQAADIAGWDAFGYVAGTNESLVAYSNEDLTAIKSIPAPKKDGNVFSGWTVDGDTTKVMKYNLPTPNNQVVKLVANWTLGESGETIIELGGNASSTIDDSSINAIKEALNNNVGANETAVARIFVEEDLTGAHSGSAIGDELIIAFNGTTRNIFSAYVDIDITQYITSGTKNSATNEIRDLGRVVDIIYKPTSGGANVKAVVREHDGPPRQYTRFRKLDSKPDVPEDGTFFVDGLIVHIYTRYFSTFALGSATGVYEVSFDTNGGRQSYGSVYTDRLGTLPTPTKAGGWKFANWLYADGTVANTGDMISANTTLTAEWTMPSEVIPIKGGLVVEKNSDGANTVTLLDGTKYGKKASIGTVVGTDKKKYQVTRIESEAFKDNTTLTSVVIGPSVMSIGGNAFSGCTNLKTLNIGTGVEAIGTNAFSGCTKLSSLTIGMTNIPDGLFSGYTSLTKLSLGKTVKSIGNSAFEDCTGLKNVPFGKGLETIGDRAFAGSGITKVSIANKVNSVGNYAFYGCFRLGSVSVAGANSSIGDFAFSNCPKVTTAKIGNTVKTIGTRAFYDCGVLKTLSIGTGVETIGADAFGDCPKLATVTIGMANIPSKLFKGYTSLTKVSIGATTVTVGNGAFDGCANLKSVAFGKKLKTIGSKAFANSGITKANISGLTEVIGDYAFYGCPNLTSMSTSKYVKTIGTSAFQNCAKLKSAGIGASVQNIGDYAFAGCTSLKSTTISAEVNYIGAYAYAGDANLGSVQVKSKNLVEFSTVGNNFLSGIKANATIKIPKQVFDQTKAVFEAKSGAGNQVKYKK